jgi:hypothetical protein
MNLAILFKVIGIAGCSYVFYLGYRLRKKRERLKKSGLKAEAGVTELKPSGDHEYPVISFTTLSGELIVKKYEIGFHQGQLKQGQKVNIYYNVNNPSDFILEMGAEKWLPIIFMAAGLLIFVAFLFSLITGKYSWG